MAVAKAEDPPLHRIDVKGERFSEHAAPCVGQPEVASLMPVGQARVIDAQTSEDGGIQIVHVHRIGGDVVAVIIRLAEGDAKAVSVPSASSVAV